MKISDVLTEFKEQPPHEGIEVLTLTEQKGFVRQSDRFNKRLATENTSKYKYITRDDFAFNPYLLWAGALARNDRFDSGVISPLYPTFRTKSKEIDPGYLQYLLLSPEMVAKYDTIAFGSVPRRRRTSVKDFLSLTIPNLPSLEKQQRIAGILDRAQSLADQSEDCTALILETTKSIFKSVSDRATSTVPLKDLGTFAGGMTPSKKKQEYWQGNIPWFTTKDLKHTSLEDSIDHVSDLAISETSLRPSAAPAIAFSLRGMSLAHTVPMSQIPAGSTVNQDIKTFTPHSPELLPVIFELIKVKEPWLLSKVSSSAHGTKKLDFTHLQHLEIPQLSSSEASQLQEVTNTVQKLLKALQKRTSKVETLVRSLQTRAFQGLL